jgi:hypothetical protein
MFQPVGIQVGEEDGSCGVLDLGKGNEARVVFHQVAPTSVGGAVVAEGRVRVEGLVVCEGEDMGLESPTIQKVEPGIEGKVLLDLEEAPWMERKVWVGMESLLDQPGLGIVEVESCKNGGPAQLMGEGVQVTLEFFTG